MDDFRIPVPADEELPADIGVAVGEFRLLPTHYQSILAAGQIPADPETILLYLAGRHHRSSSFWDLLAKHHHTSGDVTGALAACHRGWLLEPGSRPRAHLLTNMAIAANAAEPMIATMRDYSILHPSRSEPHVIRGLLLRHVGALSAAIDAVEVAIALTTDKAELWLLLLDLLNRSAMTKKAVQVSAKAIAHAPENSNLLNNSAAIMIRQHHHVAAKRYLEKALRLSGLTEVNLCNYANALLYRGSQEGAVEVARAAMALKPRAVLPRRSLVNTLPYHPSTTGASLLRESRAVSSRIPRSDRTKARGGEREKRPLTVGLLSGTLRTHPVGWLTLAALDGLPRDRFRFVCLSGPFQDNDPFSRRFRALSDDWIDFSGMTDDDLIAQARERDIDIILDLGGHGDGGRMVACANRLAPCQIKWVGMQNHSTGLAEMDWFITDRWETPPAAEGLYSERMLRLPDGYICYEPPPHAPPVGPSPALRNGHLTFGCFNNIAKITDITINLWAEIMHRIPDAVLMIKAHQLEDAETAGAFMRRFERNGIAADRVRLEGPSAHRSFLDCYNRVDIALDPFPYSGGLTTCEALWMGVPTIALHAETFASRHSVSHLSNAGFADWVTHTAEEYVARAVAWSRSVDTLVKLRASMRARVRASGLCDVSRFADGLALALTHAWRTSRG